MCNDRRDRCDVRRAIEFWRSAGATVVLVLSMASTVVASSGAIPELLRYRGEYTYGHEMRRFCPAISSQCYWVAAATSQAVHSALDKMAADSADEPYRPVCVVIEGRIDREAKRVGIAADYDGLISITRVFGRCNETEIVTQGDLQHHRWLLESIDNDSLDPGELYGMVPEIDFGARMTVSGNAGCNHFWGQAVLREQFIVIEHMGSTRRTCLPAQAEVERMVKQVLGNESVVTIGANRKLTLNSDSVVLRFRPFDWKD